MALTSIITGEIWFPSIDAAKQNATKNIGVESGCTVAAIAAAMQVRVSAGVVFDPAIQTVSQTDLNIAAADATNPRKDIIVWDQSAGAAAVVTGTPAAVAPVGETVPRKMTSPVLPNMGANDDVLLAEIYVPAGETDSSNFTYLDRRQIILQAPSQLITTTGDIIQGGTSGVPERLAKGTANYHLRMNAGATKAEWRVSPRAVWVQPHYVTGTGAVLSAIKHNALAGSTMADGQVDSCAFTTVIPTDFNTLTKGVVVLSPSGTGNIYRRVITEWGASGESEFEHSDTIAYAAVAAVNAQFLDDDVSAAFTGIAAGDRLGFLWTRDGSHASDTIGAAVTVYGLLLEYT